MSTGIGSLRETSKSLYHACRVEIASVRLQTIVMSLVGIESQTGINLVSIPENGDVCGHVKIDSWHDHPENIATSKQRLVCSGKLRCGSAAMSLRPEV